MKLYDPARKRLVAATPEEFVRQGLLRKMVASLGYPLGLISVEKQMANGRRFDLVCYSPKTLHPLLIVECKANHCNEEARKQVFGYNASLGAPFVCVADPVEVHTFWLCRNRSKSEFLTDCSIDETAIASVPFLPRFEELQKYARCFSQ